jgi:predicted Zn-dependent protease
MKFVSYLINTRLLRVGWRAAGGAVFQHPLLRASLLAGCALFLCGGWPLWKWVSAMSVGRPDFVSAQAWDEAEAICRRNRGGTVEDSDILMTLARQSGRRGDLQQAFACYEWIAPSDKRHGLQALFEHAVLLLDNNYAQRAERGFLTLLQRHEQGERLSGRQLSIARRSLSLLYGLQMRIAERAGILQQLISNRHADVYDAKYYYFPSLMIWQNAWGAERVAAFLRCDPENRHLLAAAARYRLGEGQPALAQQQLLDLYQQERSNPDLTAWLLESCFELDDWSTFERIHQQLPPRQSSEPLLLSQMRGAWCLHKNQWLDAEVVFQELLDRDAANSQATMGLARAFDQSGRHDQRDQYLQRAAIIAELRVGLTAAHPGQTDALRKVAGWCRKLQMTAAAETFEFFAAAGAGSPASREFGLPQ